MKKRKRLLFLVAFVLLGIGVAFADPLPGVGSQNLTASLDGTQKTEIAVTLIDNTAVSGLVTGQAIVQAQECAWSGSTVAATDAEATGRYTIRTLNLPIKINPFSALARASGAGLGGATYMVCTKAAGLNVGSPVRVAAKSADGINKKTVFV